MSTSITINVGALTSEFSANALLGACLAPQPLSLDFKDASLPMPLFDIRSSAVANIVNNIFPSPTHDMFAAASKTLPTGSGSGSGAFDPRWLVTGCALVSAAGGAYAGRTRSTSVVGSPGPSGLSGRGRRGRADRSGGEDSDDMRVRNSRQPPKAPRRSNGDGESGKKKKKAKQPYFNKRRGNNDPEDDDPPPPPPPSTAEYYDDDKYDIWCNSLAGRFFIILLFAMIACVTFAPALEDLMYQPPPAGTLPSPSEPLTFADVYENVRVVDVIPDPVQPMPEPPAYALTPTFLIIAFLLSAYTAHRLVNFIYDELPQILWDGFLKQWVPSAVVDAFDVEKRKKGKGVEVGALNSG